MAFRFRSGIRSSEITPHSVWLNRRQIMAGMAGVAGTAGAGAAGLLPGAAQARIATVPSRYSTDEAPNSLDDITSYNNFYEFGTSKSDPARHADRLTVDPWSIRIDGMVDRPGNYALEDILKGVTIEERIYRLRCVEAWSMVVPWNGFPLSTLLQRAGIRTGARFVAFETLVRPSEMPGQKRRLLDWPYREGLRLDEAMHPLTILATGIYNEEMPKQNGAPVRLVVPWKYGYKSIKSIVRITLTDRQPHTTWNDLSPSEYGFYSNVNPEVDHPRWSQARERRIGGGLFGGRQPTLMFNGYEESVADLYKGMDLRKYH